MTYYLILLELDIQETLGEVMKIVPTEEMQKLSEVYKLYLNRRYDLR